MDLLGIAAALLKAGGAAFFFAGTVGLLRFPDAHTRLHALTKADNLGLGLIVLGLSLTAGSGFVVLKLLLIWALALAASTTACQMIAQAALLEQRRSRPGA